MVGARWEVIECFDSDGADKGIWIILMAATTCTYNNRSAQQHPARHEQHRSNGRMFSQCFLIRAWNRQQSCDHGREIQSLDRTPLTDLASRNPVSFGV